MKCCSRSKMSLLTENCRTENSSKFFDTYHLLMLFVMIIFLSAKCDGMLEVLTLE